MIGSVFSLRFFQWLPSVDHDTSVVHFHWPGPMPRPNRWRASRFRRQECLRQRLGKQEGEFVALRQLLRGLIWFVQLSVLIYHLLDRKSMMFGSICPDTPKLFRYMLSNPPPQACVRGDRPETALMVYDKLVGQGRLETDEVTETLVVQAMAMLRRFEDAFEVITVRERTNSSSCRIEDG